jgi:hypothetical protein
MDLCKGLASLIHPIPFTHSVHGRGPTGCTMRQLTLVLLALCTLQSWPALAAQEPQSGPNLELQTRARDLFTDPLIRRWLQETADDSGPTVTDGGGATISFAPAVKKTSRGSRFALAFETSTLGLGPRAAIRLHNHLNLRIGASAFDFRRNVADGDIVYDAVFRLRSLNFIADWFPTSKGLHISPGVLVYNRNRVSATAAMPVGKVLSAGTETFVSDPQNPIVGNARSNIRAISPMVLFGFGNLLPRAGHIGFSFDFGVVFQGTPVTTVTLAGSACDVSQIHCQDIAKDRSIQSEIDAGRKTMQDDLSFMRFYPVISVGVGYRF